MALGEVVGGGHVNAFQEGEQMVALLPKAFADFFFFHLGARRLEQRLSTRFKLVNANFEPLGVGCLLQGLQHNGRAQEGLNLV